MPNRTSRATAGVTMPDATRDADVNQARAYGVRVIPASVDNGNLYWRAVEVRHLSADENRGKHNVFVRALDETGARVHEPNLRVAWTWEGRRDDEQAEPKSLDKRDGELGHGDIDLYKGQHAEVWLTGDGLACDHVANLHTDHEAAERTSDGQDGNTRFHHSFLVTFRRTRKSGAPVSESAPVAENGSAMPPPVDGATFVREEDAVPDGTTLRPGERFAKTWVIRNTGTTTWSQGYRLLLIDGDRLGAPTTVLVPATAPGSEARITVDFVPTDVAGRQRSTWQLANADDRAFGDPVWAEIYVTPPVAAAESATFPLPVSRLILLPEGAGPAEQAVAQTWNRYGGLILEEAERLGIDPAAAMAVLVAESRGEPFADGRMTIRFENHLFFQYWGIHNAETFDRHFAFDPDRVWEGHTWRADASLPMQPCHTGNTQEWQLLEFARGLDETAALQSISMGAAQIMGFNHAAIGYPTPQAMFAAFEHDAGAQVRALFRFMEVNNLVDTVRRLDYRRFALVYNGPGQPDLYANLMAGYANAFASLGQSVAVSRGARPTVAVQGERSRSPQPASPKPGVPLAEADPELYAAWREHIENGFRNNDTMFRRVLDAFMDPYWSTVWMYRILFGVGVAAFVVAAGVALVQNNIVTTLVFGGLSGAAFLGFFVSRPLQALEENLQFITWLGVIYNTYWSQLVQAQDPATYATELDKTTDIAISRIQTLMDKHAARSRARPKPQ